jgi:hypothetical protein
MLAKALAQINRRARELSDIEACMQCTEAMKVAASRSSLAECWTCERVGHWTLALERKRKRERSA